jgi:hypothetical protein
MTELARAALMDQGLLSKIERGLRPPPQIGSPVFQRIATRFGFEPTSQEYRQLLEAACEGRFGRSEKAKAAPTITVLLAPKGSQARGLSGLPPELTPPGSAAGEYLRSQGIEVGQGLHGLPGMENKPLTAQVRPALTALRPLSLLESMGLELVSYEEDERGGVRVVFRMPDGQEYDGRVSPRRKPSRRRKSG